MVLRSVLSVVAILTIPWFEYALAHQEYQTRIPNGDKVLDANGVAWPGVGHWRREGSGPLNYFGEDFKSEGKQWTDTLCRLDSDGDGRSNGVELGDPDCEWYPGQIPQFSSYITNPGIPEDYMLEEPIDSCEGYTEPLESNELNITFSDYQVVPIETTYVRQAFETPAVNATYGDMYITSFVPIIDETRVVHHMILYSCSPEEIKGYESPTLKDAMPCTDTVFAWAIGGKKFCLPENLAIPITHEKPWVLLEVHYNNPAEIQGLVDSSGIGISYVEKSTTNGEYTEAGFIYNNVAFGGIAIPPGLDYYEIEGRADMPNINASNNLTDGITVFATGLHSHYLGRKMWTFKVDQYGDKELTSCNPRYDYDLQELVPLKEPYKIYPGDSIRVHCLYDSTDRTNTTFGGDATRDEMCLALLLYYPKLPVSTHFSDSSPLISSSQDRPIDGSITCDAPDLRIPEDFACVCNVPTWVWLHGVFMVFAWFFIFPVGILFPMTQKKRKEPFFKSWFFLHKVFMVSGVFVVLVAFSIAVVKVNETYPKHFSNIHSRIGLTAVILCVFQPLNGFLRPHVHAGESKSDTRLLWEFIHQWSGRAALICAMCAAFFGLQRLGEIIGSDAVTRPVRIVLLTFYLVAALGGVFYVLFLRKSEIATSDVQKSSEYSKNTPENNDPKMVIT